VYKGMLTFFIYLVWVYG